MVTVEQLLLKIWEKQNLLNEIVKNGGFNNGSQRTQTV